MNTMVLGLAYWRGADMPVAGLLASVLTRPT